MFYISRKHLIMFLRKSQKEAMTTVANDANKYTD